MAHGPIPDKPMRWVVESFEQIGHSIEAAPGWNRAERFLNDVADGFAFGVALMWALRFYWLVIGIAIIVAGSQ